MIHVFQNNDKLSTRFIYFQPEEQRAGVTLLVCLYFFYQNKILYFNTIKCLLCQIRYLRFKARILTCFNFSIFRNYIKVVNLNLLFVYCNN